MAADDDMANLKHADGEINNGHAVQIAFIDDVGDVAMNEQLSRGQSCDLIGSHSTIRAADPELFWRLLRRRSHEKIGIFARDLRDPLPIVLEQSFNFVILGHR